MWFARTRASSASARATSAASFSAFAAAAAMASSRAFSSWSNFSRMALASALSLRVTSLATDNGVHLLGLNLLLLTVHGCRAADSVPYFLVHERCRIGTGRKPLANLRLPYRYGTRSVS